MPERLKLLFVCRHNAIRSQVAEVLAHKISQGKVQASSAGINLSPIPTHIKNWANEINKDAAALSSTSISDVEDQPFDMIITLCDKSHTLLPELSGDTDHIRWNFSHPDNEESLKHLEIEIAERLRLLFLTKGII